LLDVQLMASRTQSQRAARSLPGSSQVASGNGDLSVRTEQQATARQETAASMQELTAAVAHRRIANRLEKAHRHRL
jgi:methyl-accepting chemotaxis protein